MLPKVPTANQIADTLALKLLQTNIGPSSAESTKQKVESEKKPLINSDQEIDICYYYEDRKQRVTISETLEAIKKKAEDKGHKVFLYDSFESDSKKGIY